MIAYESPIHELSYAVLLVSKLQVFSEIWQDDYCSVGTVPGTVDLRGAITQQPEQKITSGFVCVKARETSFVINKILCQNSKFQNFAEHLMF